MDGWMEVQKQIYVVLYTFCCSLAQNTHSFTSIDDQYREGTFIYATVNSDFFL